MIVALYVLPFLIVVAVMWMMVRGFLHYERSKRAIVEWVATLGADKLDQLGWKVGPYVSIWEALPFSGSDWQSASLRWRDQVHGLQRVALHGLPAADRIDGLVRKSARAFRLYFWILLVPVSSMLYIVGSAKLGTATSTSPLFWTAAIVAIISIGIVLPFDKFRKWPGVEDMK